MSTSISPEAIRSHLDRILPSVQKPSRYLGLERNLIRKPWDDVAVRMALAFPDAYEIGMSHQGSRILYHIVNRRRDTLAERTYAPWPDMAAALRTNGIPLYTLESLRPVADFDLVGISLQSELNFINVPYLLDLSGIPLTAEERTDSQPLIIGGGPCTANPEPVADFFDAILIGDAEAALDQLLDTVVTAKTDGVGRQETLRRIAGIDGMYVPRFYRWDPDSADQPWSVCDSSAPLPVKRVWVDTLDPDDQPPVPIVPFADVVQDRLGMEIMRGCTQGCRFCQAGYWYRPVREHDPQVVLERMERQVNETGFEEIGLLSLSSADYSQVEPLVYNLSERLADRRVSVSLPSLRADAFSVGLAQAVSRVRKSGFTFAPETGSDRLRRVINKTFTNADMVQAAEAAFSKGWNLIKVYAMIGLPTETDEDLDELAKLTENLLAAGRRIRGRAVQVKVSVGCFVPKSWTPFQWEPFVPVAELNRRVALLRNRFRRIKGARLTWNDPRESAHEALLSRGDRRLGPVIRRAYQLGATFDGWGELAQPQAWDEAIAESGIDVDLELGERPLEKALPWDILDAGVRKGYLKAERRRSSRENQTPDCKWGDCVRCGIPGDGTDTMLAPQSLPIVGAELEEKDRPKAAAYRLRPEPRIPPAVDDVRQAPVHRRVRFTFSKSGDARFLSHRQTMDALERATRASGLPARYTEGFNPHIRISMGPALGLGHEGLAEVFDIDCTKPVRPLHIAAMNRVLPEGVRILDFTELLPGAPSLGKMTARARYRVRPHENGSWPDDPRGLPTSIREGMTSWSVDVDGVLHLELNLRPADGPQVSLKQVMKALGIPPETIPHLRVQRVRLVLLPPGSRRRTEPEQSATAAGT